MHTTSQARGEGQRDEARQPGVPAATAGMPVRQEPDSPEVWNQRGVIHYTRAEVGEALSAFDRAITLRPDYPEALNNRGIVRHRLGDAAAALEDFDRALTLRPRYAEALNNRAVTRMAVGDLVGALADFDRGIGIHPDYAEAYHGRAAALHAWGDLDGALADYDRVLGLISPGAAAPVHHLRAAVRVTQKRFAEAAAECTRALQIDPTFCMAYISRGNARYHLRDRGALSDYRVAFDLDPTAAAVEIVRIVSTDAEQGADEVLENCRKHVRIWPADFVAYARRGLTLALLGREAESARDLEECVRLAPDWAENLAHVLRLTRERRVG